MSAAVVLPSGGDGKREVRLDVSELTDDQRVPPPRYRHAAPSAPWPWMDFEQDVADVSPLLSDAHNVEPWCGYPQSHFANWTPDQVQRCRMLEICQKKSDCQVHKVDVFSDGTFDRQETRARRVPLDPTSAKEYWDDLQKPLDPNIRVRALFIEDITFSVLQILGASYNIEPFFFSSSANWIPSRFQEDPHYAKGDHITTVLPFIRVARSKQEAINVAMSNGIRDPLEQGSTCITDKDQTIDTQAPLVLSDGKVLLQDLLAIHMVRNTEANIIISYHHHSEIQRTTAKRLHSLVQRTGDSVYWSKIYAQSQDPTFVFLAILWYALYAWDEAFEVLYAHLSEQLEAYKAIAHHEDANTRHLKHTRELHKVQAHLLYYKQLLRDFRKSVEFVRNTPNPAMSRDSITYAERADSQKLLKLESENLLSEIERLEKQRQIHSDRLQNAIRLANSTINIEDSKLMQDLTRATLRDAAAMKQISYLTMVFLPASYLSSVFGMNVKGIGGGIPTMFTYVESTVILTTITVWIVIALQNPSSFHPGGDHFVERIGWPIFYVHRLVRRIVRMIKQGHSANRYSNDIV